MYIDVNPRLVSLTSYHEVGVIDVNPKGGVVDTVGIIHGVSTENVQVVGAERQAMGQWQSQRNGKMPMGIAMVNFAIAIAIAPHWRFAIAIAIAPLALPLLTMRQS